MPTSGSGMILKVTGLQLKPKPHIGRIVTAAVVAPLPIFVIVPIGLFYRWTADGALFDFMNSLYWIGGLAAALALPALVMTLAVGVPVYLVALRRNIASIWLACAIGFICPWIYLLGRYALIEAASPPYQSVISARYWLEVSETVLDAKFLVIPLSLVGMIVGLLFWWIAPRPRRIHRNLANR